ncbi:MAG: alpha/beta hydrolase [Gemmatimonadetes bacterium]|nr:MAG: alpha/beta hydrolase [Gemmatimonadota bacterium]
MLFAQPNMEHPFHTPQLRENPPMLNFDQPDTSAVMRTYRMYYGLEFEDVDHHFGYFQVDSIALAAHIFCPQEPRGTVIVLHGYLDHVGLVAGAIRACVGQGYAVAAYDLPGHGFSLGTPATIGDFAEYQSGLETFLNLCQSKLPAPYYAIGHSAGAAILIDYILTRDEPLFAKAVFCAPLVRSAHWRGSKLGVFLTGWWIKSVPRRQFQGSSDSTFVERLKTDPFSLRNVPLSWVKALFRWEKRLQRYSPSDLPVLILQGNHDTTVDWRYNLSFLRQKFTAAQVIEFPGAGHHLLNEAEPYRTQIYDNLNTFLTE